MVNDVASNSTAAGAGVQRGDLIVSLNGIEINALADYDSAIESANLAVGVRMRVFRNGVTRFVFMKSTS